MKKLFQARLLVKMIAPRVHVKADEGNGTEFEWDTNTIYYDREDSPFDLGFARHLREKHFFEHPEEYSNQLWSLLHELGHYFYQDEEEDLEAKAICALMPQELVIDNPELQNLYYDSPDEFVATEWAIDWIVGHPKLAKWFSKIL